MDKIQSFQPIINEHATILILGSMPGVESLLKEQYYANPRNQFWKILFSLFELPLRDEYQDKIELLQRKQIALWDVIASCYRTGSLDSNIKQECLNDFPALFSHYPQIKYVFFNGGKAYETFQKKIGFAGYEQIVFTKLPSTSPAHAVPFDNKLQEWSIIKNMLDKNESYQ